MTNEKTGVILLTQNELPSGLTQAVQKEGGYKVVEAGLFSNQNLETNLQKIVEQVDSLGVERIILMPAYPAGFDYQTMTRVEEFIADQEISFPETDFIFVAPATDAESQASILVDSLRQVDNANGDAQSIPLSALSPCAISTIDRLVGGSDLKSQLAALGFIPGSPVKVIQNFGVGPIIVSVRGGRLALGREEANKIRVKKLGIDDRCRFGRRGRRHRFLRGG